MATYTGSAGKSVVTDYWTASTAYAVASNAITLQAGVTKANVSITLGANTGYWKNGDTVSSQTGTMYLCNSDASVKVKIASTTISKNNVQTATMTGSNLNVSSLAGSRIYLCVAYGSAHVKFYGKASISLTTVHTAVTAGNKILATNRSQTGTATTKGDEISDSHFSSGTIIKASTFNSTVLGL